MKYGKIIEQDGKKLRQLLNNDGSAKGWEYYDEPKQPPQDLITPVPATITPVPAKPGRPPFPSSGHSDT